MDALRAHYERGREGGRECILVLRLPGGEIFDVNLTESFGGIGYLLFCIHHVYCGGYYIVQCVL